LPGQPAQTSRHHVAIGFRNLAGAKVRGAQETNQQGGEGACHVASRQQDIVYDKDESADVLQRRSGSGKKF
jgi:hypothetical protein